MTQASKKVIQLSHNKSSDHPLIDITQDEWAVSTTDNLNRANAILIFTQGFALGDKVELSTRATAGLYWSMECARTIIHYESGHKKLIPKNPIIDSIHYTGTISNTLDVIALFQQMQEINEVDKSIQEGMAFVMECVSHALAYHTSE